MKSHFSISDTLMAYEDILQEHYFPYLKFQDPLDVSSSSCHQTSVFHLSTHFFVVSLNLLRSSNEQGCARRVHCIMCYQLPDRTHKSYLLRSTAIYVSVPRYM